MKYFKRQELTRDFEALSACAFQFNNDNGRFPKNADELEKDGFPVSALLKRIYPDQSELDSRRLLF
jgi:hypothetical protein